MQYLVFADKRFRSNAIRELKEAFPDYSPSKEIEVTDRFFAAELRESDPAIARGFVFVESMVPLVNAMKLEKDYLNVIDAVAEAADGKRFKIEALNIDSDTGESAKTIEVKIGTELEKRGLSVDLKKPDMFVYVIFSGKKVLIAVGPAESAALDAFRANKFEKGEKISRAEFKLKEAIDYFGIDTKKIKLALDIGAAPGGWTRHLSNMGAKVIAVDRAALDYEKLNMKNVIHINRKAEELDIKTLGMAKFDALLLDVNAAPEDVLKIALRLSDMLERGAYLIMTLKLVTPQPLGYIKTASETLKGKFDSIRFKKLPHNRMEITLFAKRK